MFLKYIQGFKFNKLKVVGAFHNCLVVLNLRNDLAFFFVLFRFFWKDTATIS